METHNEISKEFMKLVTPIEAMTAQTSLPGGFLRFIGVAEVLGAIGLILPGLLRIQVILTPIAAGGLVIIMIGATAISAASAGAAAAAFPFVVGLLAASVAYGRWRFAPRHASAHSPVLQPAS